MTITFIGHGYVGLVTACIFADLGNQVYVIGRNKEKIDRLKSGDPIIYEPGLEELLKKNLKAGRLHFTLEYKEAVKESEIVFLAVGTPPTPTGEADLTSIIEVVEQIAPNLNKPYTVISCKSTVPVGTNRKIKEIIEKNKPKNVEFDIASCPEFLREGSALNDTFYPDRVVIGTESKRAQKLLLDLHEQLPGDRIKVGIESAEIIKYASNSLLSTKISFANLISFICEKTGANVEEVLAGVGIDKRIGLQFLNAGVGYGGSCFPKDVLALINTGDQLGVDMTMLRSVDTINKQARQHFIQKVLTHVKNKNVAIWGLAFKPNTDDIRFAPAIYGIEQLLAEGYSITAYDPEGMDNTKKIFGDKITYAKNAYDCIDGADALIIFTEWNEFKQINLEKVKSALKDPLIIDGRNIYDPDDMKKLGFTYYSVGR